MGTEERQRSWIAELVMYVAPLPERTKPGCVGAIQIRI